MYRDYNLVWHGAHTAGKNSMRNCYNWTTNAASSVGYASDFLYEYMVHQKTETCDNKFIVLCIELSPVFVQEYFVHKHRDKDGKNVDEENIQLSFEDYNQCIREYDAYI